MVTIREFQESDGQEVSVVQFKSFKSYLKDLMEITEPRPAEYWASAMKHIKTEDYENITFVALEDDKVVGFISITCALKRRLGTLQRIGVNPECKGKGIGKMLFQAADNFWRQRNMRKVASCVSSINPDALKFYQKCGFHVEGTLKDHFFEGVDEHQLALFYNK
jgi:ribosomal protein S18 acetylase RimI-like enzyme